MENAENPGRAITGNRPYGEIPNAYAGLGQYVSWFKRMTTNEYIRRVKSGEFPRFEKAIWQRNYFDRVIRDEREMLKTREDIGEDV